ncbi:MAG: hypothetical protein GXZ15_03425 [Campylobacter sp.]|nr:hypothetical protein [Campylobacter sp.]
MKVTITDQDVSNLRVFMLLHSKKAKKQKVIGLYALPFEFLLVGIILDGVFKFAPILTIISIILSILWLLFYPKYYKKLLTKHLKEADELEESKIEMNFEIKDKFVKFYNGSEAKASEIFELDGINRVVKSEDNYFIAFKTGEHIVLPINEETTLKMQQIKAHFKHGDIENIKLRA